MTLHKTSGPAVTPERPVKNSPEQTSRSPATPPAKSSATPAAMPSAPPLAKPATPLSVTALVAGAGMPADKLSASVVAFARFFSLPLKPELLAAIRRQGVAPQALTEPNAAREAFSLAAAAAESKGVKLNAAGLEAYAAAIDPDLRDRNRGKGGRDRRDENPDEAEKKKADRIGSVENENLSADRLRETVLESAEKNDLLAVMNRLPGKDGRRWIVLPFTYASCGRELSVSMRVLLEGDTPGTACRMVLDISGLEDENGGTGGRRVFVAESRNGEIPADFTAVKNSGENFPCECGYDTCGDGLLHSIDKMV